MSTKTILVVDDSRAFLELVGSLLNRSGCRIRTVLDGSKVFDAIKVERPDLILMDLLMPLMNGDECCRRLKDGHATSDIPVILTTSSIYDYDLERCRNSGCDDFVMKPVNKLDLLIRIKKFLPIAARAHLRVPMNVSVTYYLASRKNMGKISSISEGGLYIGGSEIAREGTIISLSFKVPGIAGSLNMEGEVVWMSDGPMEDRRGMAVQFVQLKDEDRKKIAHYVDSAKGL